MNTTWNDLAKEISKCVACELCEGCIQKVPGQGTPNSQLMIIGEAPGQQEDEQGQVFVGPAGQLLTNMLKAIDIARDKTYICNTVKCRPQNNKTPSTEQMQACKSFLHKQWCLVNPKVVLLLGAAATRDVLGDEYRISKCRGQWYMRNDVYIIATYHPSALLRNKNLKYQAWEDLKKLKQKIEELGIEQSLSLEENVD